MKKKLSYQFGRKYDTRVPNKIIYIFTEGEKTEVNYFLAKVREIETVVRRKNIKIEIKGKGYNTVSLVDHALNFISKNNINVINDDECWVVFDKDDFRRTFDVAINKAIAHCLKVAYSNESFELWFLLHFCYLDSAITRYNYISKLTSHFRTLTGDKKIKYNKSSTDIYALIKNNEAVAIRNAKKLLNIHKNERSFLKKNPSTTVHILVERLNAIKK